jgi:glutamyl-tRNA reductase
VGLAAMDAIGTRLRDRTQTDDAAAARAIVSAAVGHYLARHREMVVAPLIAAIRDRVLELAEEEVDRLQVCLPGSDHHARVETAAMVQRIVAKLLHAPMMRAKALSLEPDGERYLQALGELFEVDLTVSLGSTSAAVPPAA